MSRRNNLQMSSKCPRKFNQPMQIQILQSKSQCHRELSQDLHAIEFLQTSKIVSPKNKNYKTNRELQKNPENPRNKQDINFKEKGAPDQETQTQCHGTGKYPHNQASIFASSHQCSS